MGSAAGYVVVDIWRAKPGKKAEVDAVLADAGVQFRQVPGIVSVDYARLDGETDMYLVIFRYENREAREAFAETELLKSTMLTLRQLWDLESPIYKGENAGF